VKTLGLGNDFDGVAAMAAIKGKTLADGKLEAVYSQNPSTRTIVPK